MFRVWIGRLVAVGFLPTWKIDWFFNNLIYSSACLSKCTCDWTRFEIKHRSLWMVLYEVIEFLWWSSIMSTQAVQKTPVILWLCGVLNSIKLIEHLRFVANIILFLLRLVPVITVAMEKIWNFMLQEQESTMFLDFVLNFWLTWSYLDIDNMTCLFNTSIFKYYKIL